MVFIIA